MNIIITPLQQLSLLHLFGPDAETFLQGQACCDVSLCTLDKSIEGALCNPQGRMYASFRLAINDDESYLLRTNTNIAQDTIDRLGKYIIFSKANIMRADNYSVYGVSGSDASPYLKKLFGQVPEIVAESVTVKTATLIRLDEEGSRFECWIENTSPLKKILENEDPGKTEYWKQENIASGWGEIEAETVDMFIPQMLNYQLTGQVSFTKGCYTGQEVVARMHYRGKLKRRMYLINIETDENLSAGQPLFNGKSEQTIGNLVNIVSTEHGQHEALAVITNSDAEASSVYLHKDGQVQITIKELPYPLLNVKK